MRMQSIFDLITDSNDLLSFFEEVDTPEQLISRLERLKRKGADELMSCIAGLRHSVTSILDDTLEMSPSLDDGADDEEGFPDLDPDKELDDLTQGTADVESQNPTTPEEEKK